MKKRCLKCDELRNMDYEYTLDGDKEIIVWKRRTNKMKKRFTYDELKMICYGEIDWIKVFRDAYENRKSSWWDLGHIQEWRNATDEILFAFWKQFEEKLKEKEAI